MQSPPRTSCRQSRAARSAWREEFEIQFCRPGDGGTTHAGRRPRSAASDANPASATPISATVSGMSVSSALRFRSSIFASLWLSIRRRDRSRAAVRPESREARDGRVFLSFLFEGKRVFGINAGHELLLAVQAGQAVNEPEPVVEYGLSSVIPRVLQRCAQLFFERILERFSG